MDINDLDDDNYEIPESAPKQREDNDEEDEDDNSAGVVESVEDENEEDDENAGVEPPLRRLVRDRKEKEFLILHHTYKQILKRRKLHLKIKRQNKRF